MLSCLFPPPFFPCAAAPSCLFVCMHVLLTVHSVTMAGSGMEEGKEFILHFSRHFPTEPYKGEIDEGCGCKKGTKRPSLFFLDFQERCMWDGCSLRDLAAGKPAQEKTMHSEGLEMQAAPQPGTRRTCQEFFAYFLRYMQED